MTPESPTPGVVSPATISATEHETVITFVLSGPILTASEAQIAHAPGDLATLRERVAALERALADADARIDALSRAFASVIASSPIVEPISESVELLMRRAAEHDGPALETADSWTGTTAALAIADPVLDPATPPNGSQPPPHADDAAPKVRGLRRMVGALKHN